MRESEFQAIICLLQGPVKKLAPTYLDVFPLDKSIFHLKRALLLRELGSRPEFTDS